MPAGEFQFEDCLLKHYIRRDVWLPRCRERQQAVQSSKPPRRLKYFTFCAVGALDVLLLDRERVIRRSKNDEFDTVYFFDRNQDAVAETRKRIPGANGFPGDFVKIMLDTHDGAGLEILPQTANTLAVREAQRYQAQRRQLINSFPFDVVNLDVEQYLFRPREQLPGQLTRALREFLALQRRTGLDKQGEPYSISAFMLMFTTQVGPSGLPEDYIEYLRDTCIEGNLNRCAELREPFLAKSNGKDAATFFDEDFDSAFKLAIPKSLSELAWETDWYIDGQRGIEVFQFDRQWKEGSYRMLHLAMMLRRQDPPQGRRGPGQVSATAAAEHRRVINGIFMGEVVAVESLVTGHLKNDLEQDLLQLFQHRARYYTPPPE